MTSDLAWRKPSRSGGQGGNCVEAASLPRAVAVRDSKDPDGPMLVLSPAGWRTFTASMKVAGYGLG